MTTEERFEEINHTLRSQAQTIIEMGIRVRETSKQVTELKQRVTRLESKPPLDSATLVTS